MGEINVIKCPKCQRELRRSMNIDSFFDYGSPFRKCPACMNICYDSGYREMALEEEPPGTDENGQVVLDAVEEKKHKWYEKKKQSKKHYDIEGALAYQRQVYEESDKRLQDYEYLKKLYHHDYLKTYPRAEKALMDRMQKCLSSYVDKLETKLGSPNVEYRLKNPEKYFLQLVYDAKDPVAVESVTREVLSHYGLDPSKYHIQVEYQEKELKKDGGTLGTFTQLKPQGGIIRIVLVPRYSEYDAVVAVILHECAHALLYSTMISYPDTKENERLTDVAALYMGGEKYMQRGCFMYKSFHIGYLQEYECDLIIKEIERRRGQSAEKELQRKEQYNNVINQIINCIKTISNLSTDIQPYQMIRERTVLQESCKRFSEWQEKLEEIRQTICSIDLKRPPEGVLQRLNQYIDEIKKYEELFASWENTVQYQKQLSSGMVDYYKEIMVLAEEGDVFAKLEMIRFWSKCSGTAQDALAYYYQLRKEDNDPDALYTSGICCMQGLAVGRDENEGRSLLCKAAALGSQEAINELTPKNSEQV